MSAQSFSAVEREESLGIRTQSKDEGRSRWV